MSVSAQLLLQFQQRFNHILTMLEWSIVGSGLDPLGNGLFHRHRGKCHDQQKAAQVLLMPPWQWTSTRIGLLLPPRFQKFRASFISSNVSRARPSSPGSDSSATFKPLALCLASISVATFPSLVLPMSLKPLSLPNAPLKNRL